MKEPPVRMASERILDLVDECGFGMTSSALEKAAGHLLNMTRKQARAVVRRLVDAGQLSYSDRFGATVLERAYSGPVALSRRVWAVPPRSGFVPGSGEVAVLLEPGAAFGDGRHASTRLALAGIEHAGDALPFGSVHSAAMLDIGTGSGILAIAALKMGVDRAVGTDNDPCALFEARENAWMNGVAERFRVTRDYFGDIPERFDLVAANLRMPTLVAEAATVAGRVRPGGYAVLAGIKTDEQEALSARYSACGLVERWRGARREWAAMVFVRPDR